MPNSVNRTACFFLSQVPQDIARQKKRSSPIASGICPLYTTENRGNSFVLDQRCPGRSVSPSLIRHDCLQTLNLIAWSEEAKNKELKGIESGLSLWQYSCQFTAQPNCRLFANHNLYTTNLLQLAPMVKVSVVSPNLHRFLFATGSPATELSLWACTLGVRAAENLCEDKHFPFFRFFSRMWRQFLLNNC